MKVSQMEKVVPLAPKKKPKERVWKKAKDIAEYFGISVATISKWTNSNNDPLPSRRVRGVLQYDFELVKEWEERNTN
ncbi:helix-turn-helix domain-containing protein [Enterococcus faecium]|nr:helix-turn-helix domain-containing protein [Enterococcus faecium]